MECQMCHHDVKDSLCTFESIVGSEEHNPVDDSTLTAMFDDLQEGTLLSTLNDHVFHDLVTESKASWIAQDLGMAEQSITGNYNLENLFENVSSPGSSSREESNEEMLTLSVSRSGMVMDDEPPHLRLAEHSYSSLAAYQLRLRRETSVNPSSNELSPTVDLQQQLDCIHHDHCYTINVRERGNKESSSRSAYSSSSDSLEEGTNSDGGYETMSVTTSPSTVSSAEHPSGESPKLSPLAEQVTSPLRPSLGGHVDPVTLIDNRIRRFMSSREVDLTEEEKLTLKAEGLPIPTTLPLTKTEEKALRNVRRKIRNKVAAQESRKRKKEQLLTLEKRVKDYSTENLILRKRIERLESENTLLLARLQKLVAVNSSGITRLSTQAGACVMIIALCFAVMFGGCAPTNPWSSQKQSDYATSTVRSRSLLSLEHQTSFQSFACSWFLLHSGLGYFCTDMCGNNEGSEVIPSPIKELTNISGHRYNIDGTNILYSSLHTSNNN